MRVLGINGSPRVGGNTDILLDRVLEGARSNGADIEKVALNKMKFSACQECDNMPDTSACIINDDMQVIYKKIKECDALVFASPIFFGSLSAQSKAMIDRFQCVWRARYILRKDAGYKKIPGFFISVEGSMRKDFFENAKSIVKNLFTTINAQYKGELFCSGIDERASILKRQDCLQKAFDLGTKLIKKGKGKYMGNIFSAGEIVEMGIEIEKNGRDFYNAVTALSNTPAIKEVFKYLAGEEEKHIKVFENILSEIKKYEPSEAYPGEYFAYLKALSEEHVFTKKRKGLDIAKKVKNDKEAIELGIGFEKDSILFYYEMKKVVLEGEHKAIGALIEQEQEHLRKLSELKRR
jgi:multimeric flavodoxin WrbA